MGSVLPALEVRVMSSPPTEVYFRYRGYRRDSGVGVMMCSRGIERRNAPRRRKGGRDASLFALGDLEFWDSNLSRK